MAKTALNTIKNWFKTGLYPTQIQFWNTWDSFWHKDDSIPQNAIEGLQDSFDLKADAEALDAKQDTLESGINIKTLNGESILGEGDIEITGSEEVPLVFESSSEEYTNTVTTGFENIFTTNIDVSSLPTSTVIEWRFFFQSTGLSSNKVVFSPFIFGVGIQPGFLLLTGNFGFELRGTAIKLESGKWAVYHFLKKYQGNTPYGTESTGREVLANGTIGTFSIGMSCDLLGALKFKGGYVQELGGKSTVNGGGLSAYEVAVENGFIGTEVEWLASLKGEPGADGEGGVVSNAYYSDNWYNDLGAASKNAIYNKIESMQFYGFAGSAEDGIPENGVIYHDRIFGGFRLGQIRFSLKTADTSATLTFDVLKNGVSVMDVPVTIEPGETTSEASSITYKFISLASSILFEDEDEVTVVCSGSPTDAIGLKGKLIQFPITSGR